MYCEEWDVHKKRMQFLLMLTSFVIVGINIVTCKIFQFTIFFEKRTSINDETAAQVSKITIMQFINIAVIIITVHFKFMPTGEKFLGFLPIFMGSH